MTQYLSPSAVLSTLHEIAGPAAPGSEIIFQFVVRAATLAGEERSLVTALAAGAAAVGEPWLSFFEPEELEAHLRQMGFGKVRHFGPGKPPKDICAVGAMACAYRPTFI